MAFPINFDVNKEAVVTLVTGETYVVAAAEKLVLDDVDAIWFESQGVRHYVVRASGLHITQAI